MAKVLFEWVRLDAEPSVVGDCLMLSLEFSEWDDPLPRVGESVLPPTGPMNVEVYKLESDWVVSSVMWELDSDENEATLNCIRIIIHETESF